MKPTDILISEHRVIEQVLNCLEKMVKLCRSDGTLDADSAREAVDFFRGFADRCHHGKEEVHLFPAMEARGVPRDGGPIGVMLYEHAEGRACIGAAAASIDAAVAGDRMAQQQFVDHASRYVGLLREHIQKEDHCLFAMADQTLTEADQERLLAAFSRVETEEMGTGTHAKYVAIADRLADRYGVARAESAAGHGCHCGH